MSPTNFAPDAHTEIGCDNDDISCDKLDDENGNKFFVASEPKQKIGAVSIDVTKAILLLGYASWSELEEGIKYYQVLKFKTMSLTII